MLHKCIGCKRPKEDCEECMKEEDKVNDNKTQNSNSSGI